MTVRWTASAEDDLRAYIGYLLERDPGTADRAKRDIASRVELLGRRPGTGRKSRWPGLHEFSLTQWRKIVVYRTRADDGVLVIALYDARQDLTKMKPQG